jgi:hypothetical protein
MERSIAYRSAYLLVMDCGTKASAEDANSASNELPIANFILISFFGFTKAKLYFLMTSSKNNNKKVMCLERRAKICPNLNHDLCVPFSCDECSFCRSLFLRSFGWQSTKSSGLCTCTSRTCARTIWRGTKPAGARFKKVLLYLYVAFCSAEIN